MKIFRLVILFLGSFLVSINSYSQDADKYVYQDSSILVDSTSAKTSEVVTQAVTDTTSADTYTPSQPDTILKFNKLFIPIDSVKAIKNSVAFAYAKNLDSLLSAVQKKRKLEMQNSLKRLSWIDRLFSSSITRIVLWLLAGSFVLFILYRLFFTEGLLKRDIGKEKVKEMDDDSIFAEGQDYDVMLQKALKNENYRQAVRCLFLKCLQNLSVYELIRFVPDKTNHKYISELSATPYREPFAQLVLNYEYIWYGGFEPGKESFLQLQQSFESFNNSLKKS